MQIKNGHEFVGYLHAFSTQIERYWETAPREQAWWGPVNKPVGVSFQGQPLSSLLNPDLLTFLGGLSQAVFLSESLNKEGLSWTELVELFETGKYLE